MEKNGTATGQVFEYTYSSKRQQEIESIRKKYLPKEEDKLEMLRNLDKGAERPGTVIALLQGIIGTLILGVGMCCVLIWAESVFILGIVTGILGILILSGAYPLYKRITKRQREKIAAKILELSDELSL